MEDIYFHLPGLFENFSFYECFLSLYTNEREKFHDWAQIGSIYGAPREAFWNGGRLKDFQSPFEDMVAAFALYYNISCRFTFSNPHITDEYLYDSFCNMLLKKFNWEGHKNTVIVNSPILEEYIRHKYPTYSIVSSTTKCITDNNKAIEEVDKDYLMTVLDYNYNKNLEFLKEIKNKEKVELLINPVCMPNCSRRSKHYDLIGRLILHMPIDENIDCPCETFLFYKAMQSPLFISIDDIQNIYAPLGFKNFKIEGRTATPSDLIEILTYYMVKPEYQLEIRQTLIHNI